VRPPADCDRHERPWASSSRLDRLIRKSVREAVPAGGQKGYYFFFTGFGPIRSIVTLISFTGSTGLSPWTEARLILETTSCPSTTTPKIVYLPSHSRMGLVVMKNRQPPESGAPAFSSVFQV